MTTQTTTMCNHTFCLLPARAYSRMPAAYKVEQKFPNGYVKTTYVCESDMVEMRKVLSPTDTVIKL